MPRQDLSCVYPNCSSFIPVLLINILLKPKGKQGNIREFFFSFGPFIGKKSKHTGKKAWLIFFATVEFAFPQKDSHRRSQNPSKHQRWRILQNSPFQVLVVVLATSLESQKEHLIEENLVRTFLCFFMRNVQVPS